MSTITSAYNNIAKSTAAPATKSVDVENKIASKEDLKKAQNAAIMQAHMEVSIKSSNDPLALVYKTALEAISEELQASMGEEAYAAATEPNVDYSPEATAERIVSFATSHFGAYQKANPELGDEEAMTQFKDTISGAIDKGFDEAKDILDGLQVLGGEVETTMNATYDEVQNQLNSFVDAYYEQLAAAQKEQAENLTQTED